MSARFSRRQLARTVSLASILTVLGPRSRRIAAQQPPDRPLVAVSLPLLADIVRSVAGDDFEVYSVMPEHGDPHTWEAAPQDIVRVGEADLFISMGASLEAFMEAGGWRRAVVEAGVPQLVLSEHVDLIAIDKIIDHGDHVHDLREGDPHVWLDPRKVVEMVPAIQTHLSTLLPERAVAIEENAANYLEELELLDAEVAADLEAIPEDRRRLVVFHDAYTYFSARFGFDVVGVILANHDAEPSAGEMADLIEVIEQNCVTVVFAEPHFNTDVLDVVADEAGVAIGELLTDSFAGQVSSHPELMRFNRDSLMRHLVDEWVDRC